VVAADATAQLILVPRGSAGAGILRCYQRNPACRFQLSPSIRSSESGCRFGISDTPALYFSKRYSGTVRSMPRGFACQGGPRARAGCRPFRSHPLLLPVPEPACLNQRSRTGFIIIWDLNAIPFLLITYRIVSQRVYTSLHRKISGDRERCLIGWPEKVARDSEAADGRQVAFTWHRHHCLAPAECLNPRSLFSAGESFVSVLVAPLEPSLPEE